MSKKNAWFLVLAILLTIGLGVWSGVCHYTSYIRLWETMCDLWSSVKFYFFNIFSPADATGSTVTELSEVLTWNISMPDTFDGFQEKSGAFIKLFFSADNLKGYLSVVGQWGGKLAKVMLFALPVLIVLIILIKRLYGRYNLNHNKKTVCLWLYLLVEIHVLRPVFRFIKEFCLYLWSRWYWRLILGTLLALTLNLVSIIIAFFAFYLYFVMTFDMGCIYTQVCKLGIDLQIAFDTIPVIVWVILAWVLFCRFREKLAMRQLRHYEARNCGFIKDLPIVSMTVGAMGKKKTTMITDMALSQDVMFRQRALEGLQKFDMLFPYFPWICFEDDIKGNMENHTIYHLASVREWVHGLQQRFEASQDKRDIYGYQYEKYGLTIDDGLKTVCLFDALESYACFYFIYVIESSLIVSNYSIRQDDKLVSAGNFPVWCTNFFPKQFPRDNHHAHILDFDTLRLGKQVIEDNPLTGSFEFGVVCISEVGKERGNALELKEVKRGGEDANQKNDLFNSWLKMCRHSATVDGFPFIKVFTDEQRPESWGADARDLCDIVHIIGSGDRKYAIPFYFIESTLSEWLTEKFIGVYYDFRFRRGDNTLLVYFLKSITAFLFHRHMRIQNRFGYNVLSLETERGTRDSKRRKKKYFIMSKKVYSRRFCTDCFSDYFEERSMKSKFGLNDLDEYSNEKATVDELKKQNSYFINTLY